MQLSKTTLEILKNFATINDSILIKEGNVIETISVDRSLYARAEVDVTFPKRFAIFKLSEFLSVLSLVDEPELEFFDKFVVVRPKNSKRGGVRYFYANEELIVAPNREGKSPIPAPDLTFPVTSAQLNQVIKAASVLNSPDLSLISNDEGLSICVHDKKNTTANNFVVELTSDKAVSQQFNVYLKTSSLKLVMGDYDVGISKHGMVSWKEQTRPFEYFAAFEKDSKY